MSKKRGRPLGFRLSEDSKRAISEAKIGQFHRQETKDKISKTLILYANHKNPLSEELTNVYCRSDDDFLCNWIVDAQEDIDNSNDIRTERSMKNTRKTEVAYGQNIEYFSHNMTPETILLIKELCSECGLDIDTIFSE